jgi:hypothetical protein
MVVGGLRTLEHAKELPFKVKYNIGRIIDKLDAEQVRWDKLYKGMIADFAEKDDKGNIVPYVHPETGAVDPTRFAIPAARMTEWSEKQDEFFGTEISIDRYKISVRDLGEVQLSAAEITSMSFLFSGLDDLDEPEQQGEEDGKQESNVKEIKSKKARDENEASL